MCNIDIFKDYLRYTAEAPQTQDNQVLLEEIEKMLGDPKMARERISYLRSAMQDSFEDETTNIPNPLTEDELRACVILGIVSAWIMGKVKAEKIFELTHSIGGLNDLVFSLHGSPTDQVAECWHLDTQTLLEIFPVDFSGLLEKHEKKPMVRNEE